MSQYSKAQYKALYGSTGTVFPDNTTEEISEGDMRQFGEDGADSFMSINDNAYNMFGATASGTDTYTATLSPSISSYSSDHRYYIKFTNANTGAATLNLNTLGAKAIVKNGATALAAGNIAAGQILILSYDGTNLQVVGGFSATGGIIGSTGATDNAILRADGTGGSTLQASAVTITDAGVISNVTDPSNAQDAATKNYVDTFVNDTDIKHFESSDWISSNSANGKDWTISGSGLAVSNYGVNGTEKAFGIVALTTSTSSTGSTFFSKGGSISAPGLILGNHSIKYRNRLALENLSDGTETYSATNGFSDDLTSPTPNNCVMFRYRHSVNGGRWEAVCASGGTETATDTGVTADTLFSIFDIRINQSGTSCTFYINGSLVATITTNIPSVTMTLKFGILKSAGTTARLLVSDWYDLLITRTTAR